MISRRLLLYRKRSSDYISWKPYNSSWITSSFYTTNSGHINDLILENYTQNSTTYQSAKIELNPTLTTLQYVLLGQQDVTEIEVNIPNIKPTSLEMAFIEDSPGDNSINTYWRDLHITNLDLSQVTDMRHAFATVLWDTDIVGCNKYTKLYKEDQRFDMPKVTTLDFAFSHTQFEQDTVITCSNQCVSTKGMFFKAKNTNSNQINISNLDTSNVSDMSYMFCKCDPLLVSEINVLILNTNNVQDMTYMFGHTSGSNIGSHISQITIPDNCNCTAMFLGTSADSITLNSWSSYINAEYMFSETRCNYIFVPFQEIANAVGMFDTSSFLTEVDLASSTFCGDSLFRIFRNCTLLQTIDLSTWNLSNVTNYSQAFQNCSNLTEIWFDGEASYDNIATVSMFAGCNNLEVIHAPSNGTWDFLYDVKPSDTQIDLW